METENPTLGQSITSRQLVNIPLNGRDVLDLALLQPGVTESNDDTPARETTASPAIGAIRSRILLDGGLNNNLLDNSKVYDPNPDTMPNSASSRATTPRNTGATPAGSSAW